MGLRVPDRFLWDFWTVEHDGLTWAFILSAPRGADPEARHDQARVDLAVSRDLMRWDYRGPVFEPGPAGTWDDLTIWTGSIAPRHDGGFAMLYTGRCRAEEGRVQRVGLATSDDLVHWDRHPQPVIEADPSLYRIEDREGHTAWRDPWLSREGDVWHAHITAQHPDGPEASSGAIAHATSTDLLGWTVHRPVTTERLTGHLEVPQLVEDGAAMLVNVGPGYVPPESPLPQGCLLLLYRREGKVFRFDRTVAAAPTDARYVVKEVRPGIGLCFLGRLPGEPFRGELSDPFALDLGGDAAS